MKKEIAVKSLRPDELFLVNGFKNIYNPDMVSLILSWLEVKFKVIYRMNFVESMPRPVMGREGILVNHSLSEAAKSIGATSSEIGYVHGENGDEELCSLIKEKGEKFGVALPADFYESYGTIRFINLFPFLVDVLQHGGTLVADELDASIHPMAIMSLINVFHDDEINIHGAQLIFNTHNPIFLNKNVLRRDEIKFVNRDEDTGTSELYSLADFDAKNDNEYMKNYFVDKYGAIVDVDFSPIFKEILEKQKDVIVNG